MTVEENYEERAAPEPMYDMFPLLKKMLPRRGGDLSERAAAGDRAATAYNATYDVASHRPTGACPEQFSRTPEAVILDNVPYGFLSGARVVA